jgi:hypothetical protein
VSDLLLRQASPSRAGAEGDDDYDVIGADGLVIGRIFKATTAAAGTPWLWTLAYGQHEDRTPTRGAQVGQVQQLDPLTCVELAHSINSKVSPSVAQRASVGPFSTNW